jgi:hypothetical protein
MKTFLTAFYSVRAYFITYMVSFHMFCMANICKFQKVYRGGVYATVLYCTLKLG